MRTEVLTRVGQLEPLVEPWDDLAAAPSRPRSVPAWVISWYRHALPRGARLRVIVVWAGDDLAGVMPLFGRRNRLGFFRYQLAGTRMLTGVEPLVRSGTEEQVLPLMAEVLAGLTPTPDIVHFECVESGRRWLEHAAAQWPGRPPEVINSLTRSPSIQLGDGYETWLATRSRSLCEQLRRHSRQLTEQTSGRSSTLTRVL